VLSLVWSLNEIVGNDGFEEAVQLDCSLNEIYVNLGFNFSYPVCVFFRFDGCRIFACTSQVPEDQQNFDATNLQKNT
jgi:hypothetical protein